MSIALTVIQQRVVRLIPSKPNFMKPLFASILLLLFVSCSSAQKSAAEDSTATTSETNSQVYTGTKVGATKPVREMEELSPNTNENVVHEVNPQAFEPLPNTDPKVANDAMAVDHAAWHTLVQEHVSDDGTVDYEGFRKNRTALRAYISRLNEDLPTEKWSKNEKLAYWMNAYNAMTVDLILRNLPLSSIKDIDKPWDQRLWKLGEKWYNLDDIEHQILRKMDEPRIHFGINCASFSCPPLLNEAFTAAKVDAQLDFLATQFINDGKRNTITPDRIEISKIFNWFSKDFKQGGDLIAYLNQYSNVTISENAKIRYRDYDWTLNN